MKRVQQGFTLIELMIVVAIVGILAAVAIPAYRDYTIRSKVSEVAAAIGACKTSVAEFNAAQPQGLTLPSDLAQSGCSNTASQYLDDLDVTNGVITATAGTGTGMAAVCTLTLTPVLSGNAITQWTGSSQAGCEKYVPSTFRG